MVRRSTPDIRRCAFAAVGLLLYAGNMFGHGHANRTGLIDDFCVSIRNEFVESAPRYFSGPDPWVQLDRLPDSFSDVAVATIYTEGRRVKWVVLEMAGPEDAWFETVHYFFDQAGLIKKRERILENKTANIRVEESTYFQAGRIIKTGYRHGPLSAGKEAQKAKEDWGSFYDPNAPEYISTGDLPAAFSSTEFKQLASGGSPGIYLAMH